MFSKVSNFILKIFGWRIKGGYPHAEKKFILLVMPHTSNWDFPLGILVRSASKSGIKFLGKDSLFRFPYGFIFRWLGGYPVERSKSHNYVQTVVDIFNSKERFSVTIAPEGTRSKVKKLRTGFYYIALGAKIPIVFCKFDYANREVVFGNPIFPSGNKEADFEVIYKHFRGVKGKNPELGYLYDN